MGKKHSHYLITTLVECKFALIEFIWKKYGDLCIKPCGTERVKIEKTWHIGYN